MDEVTGRCQCGALSVRARGTPLRVGICHCNDCQRHHGAPFYAAAIYRRDAVTVCGDFRSYHGRCFCPVCGSSVFGQSGTETELHLGALDDAGGLSPDYELWTERRAAWLPPFPGVTSYRRNRDG